VRRFFITMSFTFLKRILPAIICLCVGDCLHAQYPGFSLSTDISGQRNFAKDQKFFAIGHTTFANIHITEKDGAYVSFAYYSNGKFSNNLAATAKSTTTIPQQINYANNAKLGLRHFAIGWKRYLKGSPNVEGGWNFYGYAGFGIMPGNIINTHSVNIDTAIYNVPALAGSRKFKRLTVDLGAGWERLLGGDIYLYTEARAWIPASDYPSNYLFANSKAPFTGMLAAGLRLFF
jgi:hypothetical protein